MNTTATTAVVTPFTKNISKQQKQTAKEVIAANMQVLIEQLEQGHSEALTTYLTAMGRSPITAFHVVINVGKICIALHIRRFGLTTPFSRPG